MAPTRRVRIHAFVLSLCTALTLPAGASSASEAVSLDPAAPTPSAELRSADPQSGPDLSSERVTVHAPQRAHIAVQVSPEEATKVQSWLHALEDFERVSAARLQSEIDSLRLE